MRKANKSVWRVWKTNSWNWFFLKNDYYVQLLSEKKEKITELTKKKKFFNNLTYYYKGHVTLKILIKMIK